MKARRKKETCPTCLWPKVGGLCQPKPWVPKKMPTAAECAKVVLPTMGVTFGEEGIVRKPFGGESIEGDPWTRYEQAMAAAGRTPSAGALNGRHWKTGQVGNYRGQFGSWDK